MSTTTVHLPEPEKLKQFILKNNFSALLPLRLKALKQVPVPIQKRFCAIQYYRQNELRNFNDYVCQFPSKSILTRRKAPNKNLICQVILIRVELLSILKSLRSCSRYVQGGNTFQCFVVPANGYPYLAP